MNRSILTVAGALSVPGLLLLDSAVKGTLLLVLAVVTVLLMKRQSAAARHMVWMLAVLAMLAGPSLSGMLPQWRILPGWTSMRPIGLVLPTAPPEISSVLPATDAPALIAGVTNTSSTTATRNAASLPTSTSTAAGGGTSIISMAWQANWSVVLPLMWASGCAFLTLRLLAARWSLWNIERHATVIGPGGRSVIGSQDPLGLALEAARLQLAVNRPVTLLVHPHRSIPIVWGILHYRLLLPASALQWPAEQLQSVLLHELAHVKRCDTLAQLLTQAACALYWFHPLIWVAAWRMSVERERACDDLVLASGVRPSTYAGHLLEIVTELVPAGRAQACGLAMARKSSLESRLVAVLSAGRNRRRVSVTLAIVSLVIAMGVAVPIAMLCAADDKPDTPKPAAAPAKDAVPAKAGKVLPAGVEDKLQWGEPVNGLRVALIRPQALGDPESKEIFDLRFVVQNASDKPVRISTAAAGMKQHYLKLRLHGSILAAFHDDKPSPVDVLLQPKEVTVLPLFQPSPGHASVTSDDPAMTFSAELSIENPPAGTWSGKLVTANTVGLSSAYGLQPKHADALGLFAVWSAAARGNEKIPGGLIGLLAESVLTFTKNNPTWETTPQLQQLRPRLDATRDWTGPEAVALLDEVAVLQSTPIVMALRHEETQVVIRGSPLPPSLVNAPWGEPSPAGLRLAWLLEPRSASYHLGTPVGARILIHNSGKLPVVFRTRTWHQGRHQAADAKGASVNITSTEWLTIPPLRSYRLAPGEFVQLHTTGVSIGPDKNDDDWENTRVGSWLDVKAGDEIALSTEPFPMNDWTEKPPEGNQPGWWLDFIKARLARRLPFPADAEERKRLLYRVAIELFANPVSQEINTAFVGDDQPTALDNLAKRLFERPGLTSFTGPLPSGPTRFQVLPVDPNAAAKPRVANNPGRYKLAENVVLTITRRPADERLVNEADISFLPKVANTPAPAVPYRVVLPDDFDTWAASWIRGGTVLWLQDIKGTRSIDFSNAAQVKEQPATSAQVPPPVQDALRQTPIQKPGVKLPAPAATEAR